MSRRPQEERDSDIEDLEKVLTGKRARTMIELTDRFGVTRRTIYRWLDEIQERGIIIDASFGRPTRYRIV